MVKLYLETTMFNFYVDDDRGFAHESTVALFQEIKAGKYIGFTSSYVLDELEQSSEEKRDRMMSLIAEYDITVLTYSEEAKILADAYVEQGIIPVKYRTDALHIAISAVNDLDIIASMNFQHIVKLKTKNATAEINHKCGYRAVSICSPMEVIDNENNEQS